MAGMRNKARRGGSHVEKCRSTSECDVRTLMTSDHITFHLRRLGRVEHELVGLSGKTLTQDATRRLWFVLHEAGYPHSMDEESIDAPRTRNS